MIAFSPAGLETPAERLAVIAANQLMRARTSTAAPMARLLTASPAGRSALLGSLRGRPWRLSADDAAAEVLDFAQAPAFQTTLRWTVGFHFAVGLSDIDVPVRICSGTRDLMLGALTAPRFVAAIPHAELHVLPGCGHVPIADDPDLVATAILDVTRGSARLSAGRPALAQAA